MLAAVVTDDEKLTSANDAPQQFVQHPHVWFDSTLWVIPTAEGNKMAIWKPKPFIRVKVLGLVSPIARPGAGCEETECNSSTISPRS